MIRKAIGTLLVIAAIVLAAVLLLGGRLIFPHVTGPIILAVTGVILLTHKRGVDHPAN